MADKRSIANRIQVTFADGHQTQAVTVEYPIGHPRRRAEGLPVLKAKSQRNLATHYTAEKAKALMEMMANPAAVAAMSVVAFMHAWVSES